jgi:hypothetical protein
MPRCNRDCRKRRRHVSALFANPDVPVIARATLPASDDSVPVIDLPPVTVPLRERGEFVPARFTESPPKIDKHAPREVRALSMLSRRNEAELIQLRADFGRMLTRSERIREVKESQRHALFNRVEVITYPLVIVLAVMVPIVAPTFTGFLPAFVLLPNLAFIIARRIFRRR